MTELQSGTSINKMYDVLSNKQAPAQIGKPIFAKDFEMVKWTGADCPTKIFGKHIPERDHKETSVPLNFGSKRSTGMLPDDTRIRLFRLKCLISDVFIQAQVLAKSEHFTKTHVEATPLYQRALKPMLKAFQISDFGEWIDQVQARFFFEEYTIPYLLADKFDSMPMSSPIVRVPGALGLLEGQLETDDATFTVQSNTEASYTVESKNNVVHTQITQDLLDDSAPAIIDKLRREVISGSVRAYERAILDGDGTGGGAHFDDDYAAGSSKLFVKAFTGLRKRAFDNETTLGGNQIVYDHGDDTPSKALFSELLKRTKCQGSEKQDLCYIMGCATSHDLVTGAIPELFTAFAFGSLASNVTGAVPPVFGIEGVESQLVREDLEVDGKADNPTVGTQTYMLLVQKSRFANWIRQATRVFASPSLPSSDFMLMTGKTRHAFAGIPQSDTERSVVMGINIKTV